MRIVHYSTTLSRTAGGMLGAVAGLARATATLGASVAVVGGADAHFVDDRPAWGDLEVRTFPLVSGGYGLDARAFAAIARLKPDILHVHGIWSAASVYGHLFARLGVRIVVTPHGMLDPWILARHPVVKAMHAALLERPMLARSHLHALTQGEASAIAAFMPQLAARTFVVPNGIEAPTAVSPEHQRSGALYLGRLHPKKQTLALVHAWASAPALAGRHLTIAGWGDAPYQAELAAAIARSPDVTFAGVLHGPNKWDALRRARCMILPSLGEGLPMAVLEAIQHGCVPIITDQCNLPELFDNGVALRIAADFTDFESVTSAALTMPDDCFQQMSGKAQSLAERYHWSNLARMMMAEYQRILGAI